MLADGFSLEFEWQQISSSLLKSPGLVSGSNAVVWIVSTRPPTSKSSRPFNNPLIIVPNHNWHNRYFHVPQLFNSLARSRYLFFFSLSFRLWFLKAWYWLKYWYYEKLSIFFFSNLGWKFKTYIPKVYERNYLKIVGSCLRYKRI